MIRSVAVIGAGSMGAAVAHRIQSAGFELTVCDVNAAPLIRFAQGGANTTQRPMDCAHADLVIVLVTTSEQVLAVLLGEQGLKAGLAPGSATLVAVMSTVSAQTIHAVEEGLATSIAGLVDAPITGGRRRAEAGTLTVLAGGAPETLAAMAPVFRSFASATVHCGPLGAGQAMKIINNVVSNANVVVTGEAYRLAATLGLELTATARALEQGSGRNFYSAEPEGIQATFAGMVTERSAFDSLLAIVRKDVGLAVDLTTSAPGRYPMIAALKLALDGLGDETYENWRFVGGLPPCGGA